MFKRAWESVVLHTYLVFHLICLALIIGTFILTIIAVIALPILFVWRLMQP